MSFPESSIGKFVPEDGNFLQQHVFFFDQNQDGIIYPWETFIGFRQIGAGILLSLVGAVFINGTLSHKTRPGKFPSLLFPIEIKNIKRAKHTSDSGVYDTEVRFVEEKFEEIFIKHAKTCKDALTYNELKSFLKSNREPCDVNGWISAFAEWQVLYILAKDEKGLLTKDTVRGVYDGSLFYNLAKSKNYTKSE